MIRLWDNEKAFITENLGEELLRATHLNEILDPLDDWIIVHGFDDNYDLTDEGRIAQRIYDSIYQNNSE